jgi:transcriptional regulator with XRE-family HTH domain
VLAEDEAKLLGNRRRLGSELRRLRDQAGLSGRQLAGHVGISQSKVSRIESGITIPTLPEVTAWAVAVGASDGTTELLRVLTDAAYTEVHPWSAAMRGRTHLQDDIQEIENGARTKLSYEPSVVPGLLQTAEYARRVFTMFEPAYPEIDISAVVAGRLDRQVALFHPSQGFEFLVTEAALRWRVGPAGVLLSQLDRIASLNTLENVTIGLIPHAARALTHVPHGFTIFESIDGEADTFVMVETVHANLTISDPAQVTLYRRQWSRLKQMAIYEEDARELLTTVAADIRLLPSEDDP